MHTTLFSKVHALYDRVVHGAKPKSEDDAAVRSSIQDSPSQRATEPMAATIDDDEEDEPTVGLYDPHDVAPMSAFEADDSDRSDGENWMESAMEDAVETLPAEQPVVIADEPTARHGQ